MFTVIAHHAAMSFLVSADFWLVHDSSRSFGFNILCGIGEGFRNHLFFFLAGFFADLLLVRSGLQGFIRQRAQRIGLPFLLGMLTLVPLSNWIFLWARQQLPASGIPWHYLFTRPGHLWFLEMLLFFYAATALVVWAGRYTRLTRCLAPLDAAFDWLMSSPWRLLVLLPPAMLCLWPHTEVGYVHDKGGSLFPPLRACVYYGQFFLLGWWLHRRMDHLQTLARSYKTYLLISVLSFAAFGIGHMVYNTPGQPQTLGLKTLIIFTAALYACTTTFAVTGWFLRHADTHSPKIRYLSDASYGCYLAHYPLVLWLQVVVARWDMNCWLKFTLIVAVNLLVLLPLYEWCVRYTWLGRLLNGPRTQPVLPK